ncbi:glycerate kinase [Peribacillus sp. B2I2]
MHDKAGAACGIGSAFQAFFNAETKRGVDIVMEYTKLGEKLYDADCVFTGEDLIDRLPNSFRKNTDGSCTRSEKAWYSRIRFGWINRNWY